MSCEYHQCSESLARAESLRAKRAGVKQHRSEVSRQQTEKVKKRARRSRRPRKRAREVCSRRQRPDMLEMPEMPQMARCRHRGSQLEPMAAGRRASHPNQPLGPCARPSSQQISSTPTHGPLTSPGARHGGCFSSTLHVPMSGMPGRPAADASSHKYPCRRARPVAGRRPECPTARLSVSVPGIPSSSAHFVSQAWPSRTAVA
jgi:hypothetical protein